MEINSFLEHKETDTSNIILVKNLYKAMAEGGGPALLKILSDNPHMECLSGHPGRRYLPRNK